MLDFKINPGNSPLELNSLKKGGEKNEKNNCLVAILVLVVAATLGFARTKSGAHEIARISSKVAAIENGILNNLESVRL